MARNNQRNLRYLHDMISIIVTWFQVSLSNTNNFEAIGALRNTVAQLAGAIEYTDCTSAEGQDPQPTNECPGYDIKQSDGTIYQPLRSGRI